MSEQLESPEQGIRSGAPASTEPSNVPQENIADGIPGDIERSDVPGQNVGTDNPNSVKKRSPWKRFTDRIRRVTQRRSRPIPNEGPPVLPPLSQDSGPNAGLTQTTRSASDAAQHDGSDHVAGPDHNFPPYTIQQSTTTRQSISYAPDTMAPKENPTTVGPTGALTEQRREALESRLRLTTSE